MRLFQLAVSLLLGLILIFYPFFLIHAGKVQHGFAAFCMLVMSHGLIGGLGFKFHHRTLNYVLSPLLFWLGIGAISAYIFLPYVINR